MGIAPSIGGRGFLDDTFRAGIGLLSWSYDPRTQAATTSPASQTIYAIGLPLRAGQTVANICFQPQIAGAGTTPTNIFVGLADATGRVVATSVDLKANANWASTGLLPFPLSATYPVLVTGIYYALLLENGTWGTTQMALGRGSGGCTQFGSAFLAATGGTAQTALPAIGNSVTLSASSALQLWAGAS